MYPGRPRTPPLAIYVEESTRQVAEMLAGHLRPEESKLPTIREKFSDLFSEKSLAKELKVFHFADSFDQRRRAQLRLSQLGRSYLEFAAYTELDELRRIEASAKIPLGTKEIYLNTVRIALREEVSVTSRRKLTAALLRFLHDDLNKKLEDRDDALNHAAQGLGYRSAHEVFVAWTGLNVSNLAITAERILQETDLAWQGALADLARTSGIEPEAVEWSDLQTFFRGKEFDMMFAKIDISSFVYDMLAIFGVEQSIAVDVESRPGKCERAFCAAINPPREIRLVIFPTLGHRVIEEALHELGHALHFAHVSESLAWEYRMLTDEVISESFAFLFSSLVRNPKFLSLLIKDECAPSKFCRYASQLELFTVRRYCGKVLFEARAPYINRADAMNLYADLMLRALSVHHSPTLAKFDTELGLTSFEYLLAWILEAALRTKCFSKFGEGWVWNTDAQEWLRQFWLQGSRLNSDSFGESIGLHDKDPYPLIQTLIDKISS